MKKFLKLILSIALFSGSTFFAQDTLLVPDNIDGDFFGAINKTITGDTLANGDRAHSVYKLERGKIYLLSATLKSTGYHLKIVADKADAINAPPVITAGVKPDGSLAAGGSYIHSGPGDLTLKNIYFNTYRAQPSGTDITAWSANAWAIVQCAGEDRTFVFDGCYFEGTNWTTTIHWSPPHKVVVKNCYFRNSGNSAVRWNGVGINLGNQDVDSVIVTNNTFFNLQSFALQNQSGFGGYVEFTHNTLVNSIQWQIIWQHQVNANFSNNLFYNSNTLGASQSERNLQEPDSLDWGVINIGDLPAFYEDSLGISEVDRKVDINNNNWFYSQAITDYWNSIDSIRGEPFLNERVQNFMDDDIKWPDMNESNNVNLDPGFANTGVAEVGMVDWMTKWWTNHSDTLQAAPNFQWQDDPDNDRFTVQWPLPENLTYTNAALLTASETGTPVGDLYHWFPDIYVGIEKVEGEALPESYSLEQNYPNPFNPETNISYSIHNSTDVNITVFNALGQTVNVLVNQKQNTGNYRVNWNGKDNSGNAVSSGVYFYTLKAGDFTSTRKMILLH